MIIFDLDGTLSDCEHRRHFVDPRKNSNAKYIYDGIIECEDGRALNGNYYYKGTERRWQPDWQSFYEACDQDLPIEPVVELWNDQISLGAMGHHQIWSGRCESVRAMTEKWLSKNLLCFEPNQLKMRPIGDNTPDDHLKEKWLDEEISTGNNIDFVFEDDPKCIAMYRHRGIFVFNCAQHDEEF
jgi:hypothetical protein